MEMNKSTAFETAARAWLSVKRLEVKGNTYSESYARTVEKILLPRMQGMTLGDIDRHSVADMLGELSLLYADSTLQKCQLAIAGILAEATYAGADLPPFKKIKIKSKVARQDKSVYTEAEAEILRDYSQHHRWGLSVHIMLDLGLRCSEMLALKWEDVDFGSKTVCIQRACVAIDHHPVVGSPKSDAGVRDLPIPPKLYTHLCKRYEGNGGYIFTTQTGNLMTPANYTKNRYNHFFEDVTESTSLHRLSPHELRHTCGTLLYERTGDIYAVSKFLGHSSVVITSACYVHSDAEMLRHRLGI